MALLNLHGGRVLDERIASMDAEALAAAVQQGGLTRPAERAAMAELARRVVADDVEFGPGTGPLPDRAPVLAAALAFAVWLAWALAS